MSEVFINKPFIVRWKRARLHNQRHKNFRTLEEAQAEFTERLSMLLPGSTVTLLEQTKSIGGVPTEKQILIQTVPRKPSGRARQASEVRL